ncbi:MAG: hypothetical protein JXA00_05860, partial [Candidatus Thermoplasmatota archaeon]|nr:hypothetical protein [Candidatus Thermoplasmatota archaeon]
GGYDYCVFGEAPDALDGPPPDAYDVAKPPGPIPPYIRVWLNDSHPTPYDYLLKDYRQYPDTEKVWNLSVQWVPSSSSTTVVNITWSTLPLNASEYTIVRLRNSSGVLVPDMKITSSYSVSCPPWVPQQYQIVCLVNHPPNQPSNPSPAHMATNVPVIADLSWTGGDPDPGDTVLYDVYFGTATPPPKYSSNQSATTVNLGVLAHLTTYYWRVVAWDSFEESTAGPTWRFTTEQQPDTTPPVVSLTKPQKGFLYVNIRDIIVFKFPLLIATFIIGPVEVIASAADGQSGIDRVEFYVDDVLVGSDSVAPYNWTWTEKETFFHYDLKVKAVDNAGNYKTTEMRVWKLF